MTLSSTIDRVEYLTNGVTKGWSFPYLFFADSDLVVLKTPVGTRTPTTLVLNSDYTVSGAGLAAGGTVTINPALASGFYITIYRQAPNTQITDYIANDAFPAESHEKALDRLTMQVQRINEILNRTLLIPAYGDGFNQIGQGVLPTPLAGYAYRWNNNAVPAMELYYPADPLTVPNIQSVTTSATVTLTSINAGVFITAQAGPLLLADPTGVFSAGQQFFIAIKDNGTGRAITYGGTYRAIGVTLPITTVANKQHYLRGIFNGANFDIFAVHQQA